jgi:CubicO group peptidase (beta-lactamase class C family)
MIAAPETVGCNAGRLERIKPIMQSYVDHRGFAGISTLLARKGKIIHSAQVGYQDRENKTPLTSDTIFRVYSMTKTIVCTAFMTLFEEGRFQLLDPVARFIPAFGKAKVLTGTTEADLIRPVNIRDLLTHTAGLTYNFLEDSPVSELYRNARVMSDADRSLEATIGELARLPLAYQPGTKWHYSMSIDVVGHLIEIISGKGLQQFLRERLFEPLRMIDTGFSVPAEKQKRIAVIYGNPDVTRNTLGQIFEAWSTGANVRHDVEPTYPSTNTRTFARGGYGLFSTASDYMRFAQMLLNRGELDGERILSPRTVDLMHMNHLPQSLIPYSIGPILFPGYGFGLGSRVLLDVAESAMPGSVGEYGWAGAAKTYYWVDPKEQMVGVLMSQYMAAFDMPEKDFQAFAYQALMD